MKHSNLLFKGLKKKQNKQKKNGRPMLSSKCAACGNKKLRFIKEQETKGLLNSLGLKTPLNKIPLLGDILF